MWDVLQSLMRVFAVYAPFGYAPRDFSAYNDQVSLNSFDVNLATSGVVGTSIKVMKKDRYNASEETCFERKDECGSAK